MEQQLTPEQAAKFQEQRKKRMAASGIPQNAGQMNQVQVANGAGAGNAFNVINQIKSGSLKNQFSTFLNKETTQSFKAIPTPKQSNGQQVKEESKVPVQEFTSAVRNPEADMLESMFGGNVGGGQMPSMQQGMQMQQRPMTTDLNIDNIAMPAFNPHQQILSKANQQPQMQQQGQFNQYALQNNGQVPMQPQQMGFEEGPMVDMAAQNQGFQMQQMQQMMQEIASKTVKSMLHNLGSGNANLFETTKYRTKDGNKVIKTADGKYYKITPVTIGK